MKARRWKMWGVYFAGELDVFKTKFAAVSFANEYDVANRVTRVEVRELVKRRKRK